MNLAVLNYNMGNLASVLNALKKIGIQATVENDADKILTYDKIILPGVGAFGDAMIHLQKIGMDQAIIEFAKSGKLLLGICLGMQLLFESSEEFGNHQGLNLISGHVKKFKNFDSNGKKIKIPQMGWNKIFLKNHNTLFKNIKEDPYLYFIHSFFVETDEKYILGETIYSEKFASAVSKNNIFGLQPHPEKSHNIGLQILNNFITL